MGVEGPSLAWSLLSRVLEPFYSALQLVQEAQLPFLPPSLSLGLLTTTMADCASPGCGRTAGHPQPSFSL